MLAVVRISGNQFKIQKDSTLFVPHLDFPLGHQIELKEVLLVEKEGKVFVGADAKATVKAQIIKHLQGDKVIAFKMKRRKGFRKKKGHRTHYTEVKIVDII